MLTHPSRRVAVIALSTLAMSLGMAFTPAFAQRVAENQQRTESLKTLTLSGKGTASNAEPPADSRPQPLTKVQKALLFKGATVVNVNSFTLSPDKPVIPEKAWLKFMHPISVNSSWENPLAKLRGARRSTTNYIELTFEAKVGKLYVLDFSVYGKPGGTFTILNFYTDSAQSIPTQGPQHVTAYVMAESEWLHFRLLCTNDTWDFYSVEVTAL